MGKIKKIVLMMVALLGFQSFLPIAIAQETDNTFEADVLVIGGGGAGLIAALSAAEEGSHVILLEKQGVYGGATSMSSGKIPAVNTVEQEEAGITDDSVESLMRDIYRAGEYTQNPELLQVAVENATPIKEWLELQGIKWELELSSIYYGQSTHRIHVAEGSGANLVNTLVDRVNENPNIISVTNMPVVELISTDGTVEGAVVDKNGEQIQFLADKVILTTSGFGANREMVEEYIPSIAAAVPNVAPGANGDGIIWGEELGAGTKAMNAYQGYAPISFETHSSLGSAFLDNGGILVNENGDRFINEYVGYSPLATAISNQPNAAAYMIWDQNIHDLDIPALAALAEGELITADSVEALAGSLNVDQETITHEITKYEEGIEKGEDYLNRTKLPTAFEAPYYAVKVTADFRHTQGGLTINPTTAEVLLDDSEEVIPNLYAAGGVTEGFSSDGNASYMAGNGLLQAFVFGRIAGLNAAQTIEESMTEEDFQAQKETLISVSEQKGAVEVSDVVYVDGEYEGEGEGHNGPIKVKVTVENGLITAIEITEHAETEGISDAAFEALPQMIVEANSANVDTISGATASSVGIMSAVKQALEGAQ